MGPWSHSTGSSPVGGLQLYYSIKIIMDKQYKSGIYGKMPIIEIGRFSVSLMSDRENEDRVWIQDDENEAREFPSKLLEPYIEEFFNKYF